MKVILVATPRSGSMSLYKFLRQRYSLKNNFSEIFNPRLHNWHEKDHHPFVMKQYKSWLETDNSITKIDPKHIYRRTTKNNADKILHDMLSSCDKLFYCYRRNTTEQVLSFALAKQTREWRREDRVTNIDITLEEFQLKSKEIEKRYEELLDLFNKYPGEVLCMEDILDYEPYPNRPTTNYKYNRKNIQELFNK